MIHYSRHSLKKVETFLQELGYQVRYEKGHFQSGYCIVEKSSVIVVNKFLDVTSRVQILMQLLASMDLLILDLSAGQKKVYKALFKQFYKKEDDKYTLE